MKVNWLKPKSAIDWTVIEGSKIERFGVFRRTNAPLVDVFFTISKPDPDDSKKIIYTDMLAYTFEEE